jgi:hypothetical protein
VPIWFQFRVPVGSIRPRAAQHRCYEHSSSDCSGREADQDKSAHLVSLSGPCRCPLIRAAVSVASGVADCLNDVCQVADAVTELSKRVGQPLLFGGDFAGFP